MYQESDCLILVIYILCFVVGYMKSEKSNLCIALYMSARKSRKLVLSYKTKDRDRPDYLTPLNFSKTIGKKNSRPSTLYPLLKTFCSKNKVVLSRFELSTCQGESATDQLLIGEGFVRTAKPPFQMAQID